MKTTRSLSLRQAGLALLGVGLISTTAWALDSGSVNEAFQTAKQSVAPDVQNKVVSAYGVGTPAAIQKWYIIFYDPSVPSHGRAVLVENNQITKTYPANGGATYSAELSFDPSHITSEGPALSAAQGYAAKHHIVYTSVTTLLKQSSLDKPFRWKVGLVDNGKNKGYVLISALDDSVASFVPPAGDKATGSSSTASTSSSSHSDDATAEGLGHKVQKTFLGIGGDLEEFFTGERTVDK